MAACAVRDGQNAGHEFCPHGVEPAGQIPRSTRRPIRGGKGRGGLFPELLQLAELRISDGGDRAAPGLTGSDGVTADRRGLEQRKLPRQDVVAIDP